MNTNATADTVDVQGILNIDPGQSLTLENNNDNVAGPPGSLDNSIIDGLLYLEYSVGSGGSTLTITTNSHVLTGDGVLEGQDVACKVRITSSKTLTNQLDPGNGGVVYGSMTFENTGAGTAGTFRNEGFVSSAGEKNITFASGLNLQDIADARWMLPCASSMTFNQQSLNMVGIWEQFGCSVFVFNASVRTCGWYWRDACGAIDVNNSATFEYASFDTTSVVCPNNPGSGGGTCGDPYVISADVLGCTCEE